MSKQTESESNPILEDQLGLDEQPAEAPLLNDVEVGLVTPTQTGSDADSLAPDVIKRRWYKKPKLMAALGVGALAVLASSLILLGWRNQQIQSQWMSQSWQSLQQAADTVTQESQHSSYDSFDGVRSSLTDMQHKTEEVLTASQDQPTILTNSSDLKVFTEAVTTLKNYTTKAREEADDLSKVDDQALSELSALGSKAKITVEASRAKVSVMKEPLPEYFYKLSDRYKDVIESHQTAEDEVAAKDSASKSAAEQAAQDQTDAQEAVTRWTQAYVAGDATAMKQYMTPGFNKEFNFTEVTGSYRSYNYPTTFRRVSVDKKTDHFEVVESITFVTKSDYTADTNYSNNYTFFVTKDSSSKKWLVNARQP